MRDPYVCSFWVLKQRDGVGKDARSSMYLSRLSSYVMGFLFFNNPNRDTNQRISDHKRGRSCRSIIFVGTDLKLHHLSEGVVA